MVNALHSAASGMEAQMEQIENIANNLANVNTTGFKRSRAEFQDLLYETLQEPVRIRRRRRRPRSAFSAAWA